MARHQESWAAKGLILQRTIDLVNDKIYETGETVERGLIQISIINGSGREIQSQCFESDSKINTIDVSTLSSGLYYITYTDAMGFVKTDRFIKQ